MVSEIINQKKQRNVGDYVIIKPKDFFLKNMDRYESLSIKIVYKNRSGHIFIYKNRFKYFGCPAQITFVDYNLGRYQLDIDNGENIWVDALFEDINSEDAYEKKQILDNSEEVRSVYEESENIKRYKEEITNLFKKHFNVYVEISHVVISDIRFRLLFNQQNKSTNLCITPEVDKEGNLMLTVSGEMILDTHISKTLTGYEFVNELKEIVRKYYSILKH